MEAIVQLRRGLRHVLVAQTGLRYACAVWGSENRCMRVAGCGARASVYRLQVVWTPTVLLRSASGVIGVKGCAARRCDYGEL